MELNQENYYSKEADMEYISVSQYKKTFGTYIDKGCESAMIAELKGEYKKEPTTAMLVGSFIDSYFEGTLDKFKNKTPEIFKKDGTLKSDYKQAEEIISRIERDKKFMQYMSGEKQKIFTAELFGAKWKCKLDSYLPDKAIVDLKIVDDIYKSYYHKDVGKLNFVVARLYTFQLAVYQKIVELNTGKRLPCFIAVADKGKTTNIEIIQITQPELDGALVGLEIGVKRIHKLKSREEQPDRCGRCDYCKQTKVIKSPILMSSLLED